jgi:hypothetical protein
MVRVGAGRTRPSHLTFDCLALEAEAIEAGDSSLCSLELIEAQEGEAEELLVEYEDVEDGTTGCENQL